MAYINDGPDSVEDAELVTAVAGDCIRMLMAALRGWADLLTRTNSGVETMAALGEIRVRLAQLASDPIREAPLVSLVSTAARYMSLVFDRASGTQPYRAHLSLTPPSAALPAGVDWPSEELTVAQARHPVDRLTTFWTRCSEPSLCSGTRGGE